jgi:serine/threonine-protein kinase
VLQNAHGMFGVHTESTPELRRERGIRSGTMVSAWRIERLLGTGGMGWVYRARHVLDDRIAAVKVMREDQVDQACAVARMMREAAILATVGHAGIPPLYECGLLADGRPWIAMELVDGTPLTVRMTEGAQPHGFVIELVGNVADVLASAHACDIVHRDLKPENVLVTPTDARFPVRVIDWGIAHHRTGANYTHQEESLGTPTYMAPEQARGGPTDGYSDVYGLGVLAYQALAGRPPFVGHTSVDILVQHLNRPVPALAPRCPDAPFALVQLVERMLAKHFEQRPSAIEIRHALRDLHRAAPTYLMYAVDGAAEGTAPTQRLAPTELDD